MTFGDMPVGRKMDALVAEKIMGFEYREVRVDVSSNPDRFEYRTLKTLVRPRSKARERFFGWDDQVPQYSTNVAAAWEVVEKMGELGYTCHIEWKGSDRTSAGSAEVTFVKHLTEGHGVGTMPEAVCRAALMAVEQN